MSSFPISISWQVQAPPTGQFDQLAKSAQSLDQALMSSGQKFDQFGQTISQLESPLSSVGSSMGELSSNMGQLEGSLGSAGSGMGELASSTEQLNGSIGETGGFITEAATGMGELASGATESGSSMTELGGATTEFNGVIGETGGFVTEAGSSMTEMGTAATDTGTAMTDMGTATTETNTALTESVDALGNVVPGLTETGAGAETTAQGFEAMKPPIEDTNAALDSSSGLLEGVSPLLADTGTNAADAGTATGEFSGALGNLNTELGPVNGGLTDSNTLVADLGTEAGTTADSTKTLGDNMNTLVFGLTAAVSAGIGLVNSFLSIRDAGFRVEAANIKAEKSAIAVDKAMLGLSKSIQKLATDSEAPIQGMTRLQTAFANFQKLVAAGITSGPQYAAALNELKGAAAGLEGATVADNNAIAAFQIQLDGVVPKINKASLDQRKLNKATEEQTKAFIEAGLNIAAFAGGLGATIQTITSAGTAATALKGGFAALGTTISSTVLPALAGIAVPVGIAVAAIGAFIAVVTAIRANLRVFDELGVSVGKVFPEMVGFLNDARQAFINLSDGINSAIAFILGGIDSFAGGTTNLKEQWTGFTDTLPQGTGEMGIAGQAVGGLGVAFTDAANKVKIGNGAWKDMGGTLVAFSGNVTVAAGSWRKLDDQTVEYVKSANQGKAGFEALTGAATANAAAVTAAGAAVKEQSANYSELTAAQKLSAQAMNTVFESLSQEAAARNMSVLEAQKYLSVIEGITPAVGLSGAAIVGMAAALQGETQAHFDAVSAAAEYIQGKDATFLTVARTDAAILAYAEKLKEEEKATGKATEETAKHVEELNKLQQSLVETGQELTFYSDAANKAARMQLEFNTGLLDAQKAIQDETFALARLAGELSNWNDETQRAQAVTNAFNRGLLEQVKATQGVALETAKAQGAVAGLAKELSTAGSATDRFNKGMAEGRKSALEFIVGLAEAAGEAVGFRTELVNAAEAITDSMVDMTNKSTDEIQKLIEVAAGIPGAFDDVASELDSLANEIISTLADAAREGGDKFMDEIDAMEEQLGQKFSEPMIQELELQANIQNAEADIKMALGNFAAMLQNKPLEVAMSTTAAQDALRMLQNEVNAAANLSPKFQPLQAAVDALAAWTPGDGLTNLPTLLTNVVQEASKIEGGMQMAIQGFDEMFNAAAQSEQGLASLTTMFQKVGYTFDAQTGIIKDAAGTIVGDLQTMHEGAGTAAAGTVTALDTLGPAGTAARTTLAYELVGLEFLMDRMAQEVKQSAIEVSTAFANMATNTGTSLNTLASGIIIMLAAFAKIGTGSQSMATTVSGAFSNMANNTRNSMNTMASGIIILITSFTRMGSDAQRGATTVGSAFTTMGSRVASASNTARTAITNLTSAVNTLASSSGRVSSFGSAAASAFGRVQSSASSARSAVSSLQSAINSLRSKSITITVTTVYRTVFAAKGGAFIANSPMKIGPMHVSEFGQAELVSVHPLENPGGQTITGPGMQVSTSGPGAKAFAKSGDKSISLGDWGGNQNPGDVEKNAKAFIDEIFKQIGTKTPQKKPTQTLIRELPIVIKIGDRTLLDIINRRLFEISDSIIT
jgi:hypothetical protein